MNSRKAFQTGIPGYMECNADLLINGIVEGDIFCSGTVFCAGIVTGNIRAKRVELHYAYVIGEITCREISTDSYSFVSGEIIAQRGTVNCRLGKTAAVTDSLGFN